jgi:hypothetical protein
VTQSEPKYTKCEMARARACHRHAEAGLEYGAPGHTMGPCVRSGRAR